MQFNASDKLPGKYDIIVLVGTLEHMDNPLQVLKVCKKHLNKNGKIIATVPNWLNPRGYVLLTLLKVHIYRIHTPTKDVYIRQ